ncbi:MAG: siroheme synthase CysG [Pseudomonadota bacterium]
MQSRQPSSANAPRVAALETLPLFFSLKDKRALVAGGSDAAAWKAELLAATGAQVTVIAPVLSDAMDAVVARDGLHVERRDWQDSDFEGCAIAIGDVEDGPAFAAAARQAGVPVNTIDQPATCDFQFGSIVNRSPVVIGISTGGAAPILGQAIRRKIETLLPASVSAWAALAKSMRAEISKRWPDANTRRQVWQRFADKALRAPAPQSPDDILACGAHPSAPSQGRVTLVGAGPGDAELLTLKAVRALQSADVILFDDLISPDVLELARREAKRMLVGKRGHRPSCRQEDINDLMMRLAKQGKHVVRLKSGDPMIFGRAGEEIAMLEAAGISVSVVPGVTSALAAAAQAKISLTHRDHAQSVRFVTGHSKAGCLPDLDFEGLADPRATLMVYMGGRTAQDFAQQLLDNGLKPARPVAAFRNVGRPDQSTAPTTLGAMAAEGLEHTPDPILIGIGDVFEGCEAQCAMESDAAADAELRLKVAN